MQKKEVKAMDIPNGIINNVPSFKEALKRCKEVSGLTDLQICQELKIDTAQFSRIWSSQANFPHDKILEYMNLCKNIIPLQWLAKQYGMELKPLKSILEIELEKEKVHSKELEKKLRYFEEIMQKVMKK